MINPLAEHVRKIGGQTLKSIGDIARTQHVLDNDADYVDPLDMLAELLDDNNALAVDLRRVKNLCGVLHDVATARLIENWIGETERRTRCLLEADRLETGEI
jgi:starvation-inducible DNA-binding protein